MKYDRECLQQHGATRRDVFLTTARAVSGLFFVTRSAKAVPCGGSWVFPIDSPLTANEVLGEPAATLYQTLATRAVDAAIHAEASYADVRIAEQHVLDPEVDLGRRSVRLSTQCTYGVRALVNGVWGFAYGRELTPDAVTQCAKDAVAAARISARVSTRNAIATSTPVDWRPAPVATGEWHTPVEIDPFTVPLQQQGELLSALVMAVSRVPNTLVQLQVQWLRETRVFAASTGALTTQYHHRVVVRQNNYVIYGSTWVALRIPELYTAALGYEALARPGLQDRFRQAAEEALALTRLPVGPLEVGRYPVVFDGTTMGAILTHLVGPALELDRVLGAEPDTIGTSIFAVDQLGTLVTGPLLTITGHRALPSVTSAQWDDEGNLPQEHCVINNGQLTDFHTTGQTVSALTTWYQQQGRPIRSNGCAMAAEAQHTVLLQSPHLTVTTNSSTASLDDLIKDMAHGILVVHQDWIMTDPHLGSASFYAGGKASASGTDYAGGMLFEVMRGKIVRRLHGTALQFHTLRFLKGITALGGAATVHHQAMCVNKGFPWQAVWKGSSAPAAFFKEIDAISLRKL